MTEISERYARLADTFADKVAAVPPDRWSAPTPCENWTARDLVGHVVLHDLENPERAAAEFEGSMGTMTFEGAVDRFLAFDLVVHGWDLSRAVGLDEQIAPDDLARVRGQAEAFGAALRSPQAFGPEVVVSAGADEQVKLLAFLGRTF